MATLTEAAQNPKIYKTVQQITSGIVRLELERIEAVARQNVPPVLKKACRELSDLLQKEQTNIWDFEDLWVFREKVYFISLFIDFAMRSSPERSSSWAEPLIKECYEICKIPENRTILIIHNHDTSVGQFGVIPNVFSKFKNLFTPDLVEGEALDIFIIPAEARFDLAFITPVAHEVGHVYWQLKQNADKIKEAVQSAFSSTKQFTVPEDSARCAKHIEEYLCDQAGSYLLGPAFDYSLLRFFSSMRSSGPTDTHPSINRRINRSRTQLLAYAKGDDSLSADFENLLSEFGRQDNRGLLLEEGLDKIALETANSLHQNSPLKISKRYNPQSILNIMAKVTPELDAFRPPFETVNDKWPTLITPIEALMASVLYFHIENFDNNEFFSEEDKKDATKKQAKIEILRHKIIDHVHYAISLYGFTKSINKPLATDEFDVIKERTLWGMRQRVQNEKPAPFVVVPTTDPKPQYGQNSVDLRLGSSFLVAVPSRYTHIEPQPKKDSQLLQNHFEKIHVPIGEDFILHPHQFVLASILEYISLPHDYYALILGRSTWGRLGLNIATATTVQAGYRGCLTLELRNLGESPLPLKTGVRIAQLCLINMPEDAKVRGGGYFNKGHGKYIGPVSVGAPQIHDDADWELLGRYTNDK